MQINARREARLPVDLLLAEMLPLSLLRIKHKDTVFRLKKEEHVSLPYALSSYEGNRKKGKRNSFEKIALRVHIVKQPSEIQYTLFQCSALNYRKPQSLSKDRIENGNAIRLNEKPCSPYVLAFRQRSVSLEMHSKAS